MEVFLETDRLLLRRFTADDVDNLVELDGDPDVMRFITGGRPTPREEIRDDVLPAFLDYYRRFAGYGFWAAIEKSTGAFLGWFHLRPPEGHRFDDVELGYRLRKSAWGKGYATEASRALVREAFTELGARRVYAETMAVNLASRRVMEKAGLRLVRSFHQPWPDHIDGDEHGDVEYALRRDEWEEQAGGRRPDTGGMDLPVLPPVAPMLAKPIGQLPDGPYSFEPKWDGFRTVVFRDGDQVQLGSRNERPLTRYFPELIEAITTNLPTRCVIDAEIVVPDQHGRRLDFDALLLRIHPAASRVRLLAAQTPARLIAFDLLALGDVDYTAQPLARRRAALEEALAHAGPPVHLTPATTDRGLALEWLGRFEGAGLDGVVAKRLDGVYEPDWRGWLKVKHQRTADCVVGGYRLHKRGPDALGSLLLGLHTDTGELASVGVVGAFPMARRRQLLVELQPLVTSFQGHPWDWARYQQQAGAGTWRGSETSRWNPGKELSFVPLRPERVVEVRYDHLEGRRFRHMAQFVRWRPDRDPRSCTYAQLEETVSYDLADVLATRGS